MKPIIEKVDRELLLAELTPDKFLRRTNKGDNEIYVVDAKNAPAIMREIGRLREIAFRDAGGGTGLDCDIDEFDTMEVPCRQMIVWSPETREIIGGYRFILGEDIRMKDGKPNIATSHLFNFSDTFIKDYLPSTIELGRSFVVIDYQNTRERSKSVYALDNLWDGLGALTLIYPQIKHLFGKVTMYPSYDRTSRDLILGFMLKYFPDPQRLAWPIEPLVSEAAGEQVQSVFTGGDYREDFRILNREVRKRSTRIPPLVNAYMSLSSSMKMLGTAINHEFGEVEETGIFFNISEIFEDKKERHIDTFIKEESGFAKSVSTDIK